MHFKVIDLRPDSKLLKPNFDGYKLSLETIPILRAQVPSVDKNVPLEEYSYLHSFLHLHNHLTPDYWLRNNWYYVSLSDGCKCIQRISYNTGSGRLSPPASVFRFSGRKAKPGGGFNCGIRFLSEKFALLSDGVGNLWILDTGDRQKCEQWKEVQPALQLLEGTDFIIQDARLVVENGELFIHCLILHIAQDAGKHFNVIHWFTFKQNGKIYEEVSRRVIRGTSAFQYLELDPRCTAIVYSSNKEYKFTFDSVKEIIEEKIVENQAAEANFEWFQSQYDVTISFKKEPEATKDQFSVKCEKNQIEVEYDSKILLNSVLFAEVDSDLTTWSLDDDLLQVTLVKKEPDTFWPYLIPGGPPMSVDSNENANLADPPISDLNAQMEECDFGTDTDDEYFIARLDPATHKTSHKVFLSSNQVLFSTVLRPGKPRALGIRNDVDCCLWLQQQSPSDILDWSLKHDSTLHAFGYIQASKREKKYMECSPDANISVIAETSRHIFIYKNFYSTAGGLRKRTGPQLEIGQQKLVSLDGTDGEILGMSVENDVVVLLFANALSCLQLRIEE